MNATEALAEAQVTRELDAEEREVLASHLGTVELEANETLVKEGEARRELFIVVSGRLAVCKSVGAAEETVYVMKPGECAGTRAFVDGSTRKAALRATEPTTVLTLDPDAFEGLLETHPRLVYRVMRGFFRVTHGNLMRMNLESAEMRNYMLRQGGLY